jgi:hypothetical protein
MYGMPRTGLHGAGGHVDVGLDRVVHDELAPEHRAGVVRTPPAPTGSQFSSRSALHELLRGLHELAVERVHVHARAVGEEVLAGARVVAADHVIEILVDDHVAAVLKLPRSS